jgi:ribosome-binding factor A
MAKQLRVDKVQELIKQELSNMLLMDVKDPRIKFVTVTDVKLTRDMSQAKVYVSIYGSKEEQKEVWDALQKAVGYMRTEIAKRIRLRFAPELVLERDTSLEYGAHIDSLLNEIKKNEGTHHE